MRQRSQPPILDPAMRGHPKANRPAERRNPVRTGLPSAPHDVIALQWEGYECVRREENDADWKLPIEEPDYLRTLLGKDIGVLSPRPSAGSRRLSGQAPMPHSGAPKTRALTAKAPTERSSLLPRCASSSDAVRDTKYQIYKLRSRTIR
jgi:hypothetical protein